ncbi:MAG: Ankyrin-3 [Bogoriella megaspora]|nr:MAG: Ankyrin-3 [Bogoriella megaspora]
MTKDWPQYKGIIRKLYVEDNRSLTYIQRELERAHSFCASTRIYRAKLKEWGFNRAATYMQDNDSQKQQSITITNSLPAPLIFPELNPPAEFAGWAGTVEPLSHATFLKALLDGCVATVRNILSTHTSWLCRNPRFEHQTDFQSSSCLEEKHKLCAQSPWLTVAARQSNEAVLSLLLDHGFDPNAVDQDGCTPLHLASTSSRFRNVELLVAAGASVDIWDRFGQQPLHAAINADPPTPEMLATVRKLLESGADVNARANLRLFSQTPLEMALNRSWDREVPYEVVETLLIFGASTEPDQSKLFRSLIEPWQSKPFWWKTVGVAELYCLQTFLEQGADPNTEFRSVTCSADSVDGQTTLLHEVYYHTPGGELLKTLLSGMSRQIIEEKREFDISFAMRDCVYAHDRWRMPPAYVLRHIVAATSLKGENQFPDASQFTRIMANVLGVANPSSVDHQEAIRELIALAPRCLPRSLSDWADLVLLTVSKNVFEWEPRTLMLRIALKTLQNATGWKKIPILSTVWDRVSNQGYVSSDTAEDTNHPFPGFQLRPYLSQLCQDELLQTVAICLAVEDVLEQELKKSSEQRSGPRIQKLLTLSNTLSLSSLPGAEYLRNVKIVFLAPVDGA